MEIIEVKSSGSEELLLYCLSKGVNLQKNAIFAGLIGDDIQYRFILDDINQFELFYLTQRYRTGLHVLEEHQFVEPEENYLTFYLGESDQSSKIIRKFINLTNQMLVDKDIIDESLVSLFLPMITRRYKISIPISFQEILITLTDEEYRKVFNSDYVSNLDKLQSFLSIKTKIASILSQLSDPISYTDKQYKILQNIFYKKLRRQEDTDIYQMGLLKFGKRNHLTGIQVTCNPSMMKKESLEKKMKELSFIKSPMELEFVIQVPIYHMQLLLNIFDSHIIQIAYPSSIKSIVDNGMNISNIQSINFQEEKENLLSSYTLRITECNQLLLETISSILQNEKGEYTSSVLFSLLPSLYLTNAVVRINEETLDKLLKVNDKLLSDIFHRMKTISNKIQSDIIFTK